MGPSRLVDGTALVLDASSGLNLLGTGRAAEVLRALPHEVLVTDKAAAEIGRDPITGTPGAVVLSGLATEGLIRLVPLSDPAYDTYLRLVAAPSPDGLDDGEAATLAHAADAGAVPVLDERKATRIAAGLRVAPPVCSLDLLSHPALAGALGASGLADAVHSALHHAKMRVPEGFRSWVLGMIDAERLRGCSSIPKRWLSDRASTDQQVWE